VADNAGACAAEEVLQPVPHRERATSPDTANRWFSCGRNRVATCSSAINTIERNGFVAGHDDATDGRMVRFTLTSRGEALIERDGKRQRERTRAAILGRL
jgi:hypothetical protein